MLPNKQASVHGCRMREWKHINKTGRVLTFKTENKQLQG